MSIEEDLKNLRTQITATQQRKMRAEVEAEQATTRLLEAQSTLKEKYKVDSVADAEILRDKLEAKIKQSITDAENKLKENA